MMAHDVFLPQQPLSSAEKAFYIVLVLLCLFPILSFPISHDHAIFYFGGKAILEGKLLYRDFVDVKPPLIYYVFAAIQTVFGSSELAMRLFDFLWQLLTVVSLRFIFLRWTQSERLTYGSLVVYALSYTISNYSSTLQCETLAVLPMLWLFYLYHQYYNKIAAWLAIGVLYACLVYLKYTFGIVLLPLFLFDFFRCKPGIGKLALRYAVFLVGFSIISALLFFPLLYAHHGMEYYVTVLTFTRDYAAQHSQLVIGASLQSLFLYYADKFSLVFSLGAATAVFLLYKQRQSMPHTQRDIFYFLLTQYAFLLFSIIVEQKFIPYHFSRLYGISAPFVAFGIYTLWYRLRAAWQLPHLLRRLAIGISVAFLLLATPLPRFARIAYGAFLYVTSPEGYTAMYTKSNAEESVIILADQLEAVELMHEYMHPHENVAIVSVAAPCVYYYLQPRTAPALPGAQFYLPEECPQAWRQLFVQQLRTSDWLVVQTNDIHPLLMMGIVQPSSYLLAHDALYAPIFKARYREVQRLPKFVIYRAIAP